ncbi:GGDEF domain-containing protein [Sideroxyarcus sp. TK5]|jgi:diguanylate cyclase
MKYPHERSASAEVSRIALQKMAAHQAAFTPPNFAVWYEYVSGINPELSSALEKLLKKHTKLQDEHIEQLYADHVSECGSKIHLTLREDLKQLLERLNRLTSEADEKTSEYGDHLQDYGSRLQGELSVAELDLLVKDITQDTERMHTSVQKIHVQLEASHQEVERLNRELEALKGAAMTDPLTGVLNRRGFESCADTLFAEPDAASHKGFCLLMLDVDHFKNINDNYGHLLGDKVLTAIATTLKSKVQGQDLVGRLGGEEFAILLPNTNLDGAFVVAEHIRQAVQRGKIRRLDSNQNIDGITISIGISPRKDKEDLNEMIARADKALYRSKKEGRNRITILD